MFTTLGMMRSTARTVASRRMSGSAPVKGKAANANKRLTKQNRMRHRSRDSNCRVEIFIIETSDKSAFGSFIFRPASRRRVGARPSWPQRQQPYRARAKSRTPVSIDCNFITVRRLRLDFAKASDEKQWQG